MKRFEIKYLFNIKRSTANTAMLDESRQGNYTIAVLLTNFLKIPGASSQLVLKVCVSNQLRENFSLVPRDQLGENLAGISEPQVTYFEQKDR